MSDHDTERIQVKIQYKHLLLIQGLDIVQIHRCSFDGRSHGAVLWSTISSTDSIRNIVVLVLLISCHFTLLLHYVYTICLL